jgi:hypothetical protein
MKKTNAVIGLSFNAQHCRSYVSTTMLTASGPDAPSANTACKAGTLQFPSARFVLRCLKTIKTDDIRATERI